MAKYFYPKKNGMQRVSTLKKVLLNASCVMALAISIYLKKTPEKLHNNLIENPVLESQELSLSMKKWELVNFSIGMQRHQCKAGNTLLKILKFVNLEIFKEMIVFLRFLMATEGLNVLGISKKISFGQFHHSFCKRIDKHGFLMHSCHLTKN